MLATSKNVLFPGNNHLQTTGTGDPSYAGAQVMIKVSGHQYWWLAGGYSLERTFLEVASMVVTWWIVAFCALIVLHSGGDWNTYKTSFPFFKFFNG